MTPYCSPVQELVDQDRMRDAEEVDALVPDDAKTAVPIAAKVALSGDMERAAAVVDRIADPQLRRLIYTEVAKVLAQNGKPEAVKFILGRADAKSPEEHEALLGWLAVAHARAGDVKATRTLAGRLKGDRAKARAYGEIAGAMAAAGDFKGARSVAVQITDEQSRDDTLVRIAAAQGRAADADGAIATVKHLPITKHAYGYTEAVIVLAEVGDMAGAEKAAVEIPMHQSSRAYGAITDAHIRAGRHAEATASRAKILLHRLHSPETEAIVYLLKGDLTSANQIVADFTNPEQQANGYMELARTSIGRAEATQRATQEATGEN